VWCESSGSAAIQAGEDLPHVSASGGWNRPAFGGAAGGRRARKAAACWSAADVARLGVFLALATSLHIFEAQLPALPIPGAKIGLANLVSLFALYAWGFREALLIVVMRQIVGSLVTGTIFAPAFVFGVAGGTLSVIVMALVLRFAGALGPVAVSLMGATAHNIGQLFAAWAMLGQVQVFYYLPYLLWFAVPSGALVGVTAKRLLPFISLATPRQQAYRAQEDGSPRALNSASSAFADAPKDRTLKASPAPARPSWPAWSRPGSLETKAAWLTGAFLIAVGTVSAFSLLWQPAAVAHPHAQVTVNGEVYALLPLEGEGMHELVLGDERMVIEWRDGNVRVAESTCRNQVCVRTGWIGHPREAIACVPFQVLITITGGSGAGAQSDALEYDAVVY